MTGAGAWQALPWDTDFLGFGVGRLDAHYRRAADLADQVAGARAAGLRRPRLTGERHRRQSAPGSDPLSRSTFLCMASL